MKFALSINARLCARSRGEQTATANESSHFHKEAAPWVCYKLGRPSGTWIIFPTFPSAEALG